MENPEQEAPSNPGQTRLSTQHSRTMSVTSDQDVPTFAQLLSTTSEDKQSIISGVSSTAEEEHLKSQLLTARKKLEHFTEVSRHGRWIGEEITLYGSCKSVDSLGGTLCSLQKLLLFAFKIYIQLCTSKFLCMPTVNIS